MAPVARPDTRSWMNDAIAARAGCPRVRAGPPNCGGRPLLAQLGQDLDDLLLPVHDLAEEAFAVDVAVLVPGGFHQDAGLLRGRDGDAVGGRGEALAVELAHLFRDVLDEIDGGVALDAIVVADVVEALLEALGEL